MIKLGVHVSIAGGLAAAVDRASDLGCAVFQMFLRNPRSFQMKEYSEEEARSFRERMRRAGITYAVAHCVYTQNLVSASKKVYQFSIEEFIKDCIEAGRLGIPYIITHTGSYKGSTHQEGVERLTKALRTILSAIPKTVCVLLENSALMTNSIGYRIQDLSVVFDALHSHANIGICLDTCHLFAAGYDIRKKEVVEALVQEIKGSVGIRRLKIIHLNDSKFDMGTYKDRHQHIGKGKIGNTGIKNILSQKEFSRAGFILETPKDTEEDDAMNLAAVKKLYQQRPV